ncbi:MAG: hypothetical protein HUJ26_16705, partial [Planctomycetaceae bacterium]|nr:hypothetical protein [Planctomycetaceae bacterium]
MNKIELKPRDALKWQIFSLIQDQRDLEQAHIEAKGEKAFGSGPDDSRQFCHAFLQADR